MAKANMIVATFSNEGSAASAERDVQECFFNGIPVPVREGTRIYVDSVVVAKKSSVSEERVRRYLATLSGFEAFA